jgi:large subunit ribosomal protein L9
MEVVLLENIKNLGQIGDIVKVRRGHGRNFLIKYGKALKASKENIDIVNKKKDTLNQKNLELKKMQKKFLISSIKKITNFLKEQKSIMNCMEQ